MMQNIFDNFIIGKLSVGKEKRYLDPSKGGVGDFFPIRIFRIPTGTVGQKAHMSKRDNWRNDISNFFDGNCLVATPKKLTD
jgi:hypothetical protein